MPVKFNAYPPDRPALVRVLDEGDNPYRIGRSNDCELRIDHPSISRYHAELIAGSADSPWKLRDTASKNGMVGLKGYRTVGGIRASIYNAMPVEGCSSLAGFMKDFASKKS